MQLIIEQLKTINSIKTRIASRSLAYIESITDTTNGIEDISISEVLIPFKSSGIRLFNLAPVRNMYNSWLLPHITIQPFHQ